VIGAALYLILAYLIGAIPTGYLIAKQLKGIDIREHGSGNVGSTNVRRVVGKKAGYTTLVLDFLKGLIAVSGAKILFHDPQQIVPVLAGVAAVIGHSRSVFIGFKGGKSVITSSGVIFALEPWPAIILTGLAFVVIKLTRYVSIGSLLSAILLPVAIWLAHGPLSHLVLAGFICIYVIYLHRGNIDRLIHHQENRI